MIKTLISKTTPEFKNGGDVEKIPFEINMGSPEKDGLSFTAFDCYCENALVGVREEIKERIDGKQDQTYRCPSNLPEEAIYADDADFISHSKQNSIEKSKHIPPIFMKKNFLVNTDKTELVEIKRTINRLSEGWRKRKKLGTSLGDEAAAST